MVEEGFSMQAADSIWHGATCVQNVRHVSLLQKSWARSVLAEVEKERQNGTDGAWQQETPLQRIV